MKHYSCTIRNVNNNRLIIKILYMLLFQDLFVSLTNYNNLIKQH